MYFWNSYPFIRFTLALVLGIILYGIFPSFWNFDFYLVGSTLTLLFTSVLISSKTSFYKLRQVNGALALIIICLLGGSIVKQKSTLPSHHYTHLEGKLTAFTGRIDSPPNERTKYIRYDLQLETVISKHDSTKAAVGRIHLYVKKDSTHSLLRYGDRVMVYGNFYPIPSPDNPDEFNYMAFLEKQYIYAHSFVQDSHVLILHNDPQSSILAFAFKLRSKAAEIIDQNLPTTRENGIAKALLLGIKDYLDNDIKKAYSAAGAMHVLAVSGLHVGIVFMLIQILFGKLRNYGKLGKYVFALISLLSIWTYACLTGLSPSVLRAATMFSFISLGQFSSNQGNIYNTLGFSAFVLLLINPNLIYSVGFQLSYAAVLGIVYIQPLIYRQLNFRYYWIDKAWSITCVSIAAQLATFPLSAYYFHQFPTYFLISNLIVIPASFLLLVLGISMIIIQPIVAMIGTILGKILNGLIWGLNELISQVHELPNSLIEWIHLDAIGMILTYIIVISLISSLHFRSFKTLVVASILFLSFMYWNLDTHEFQQRRKELIFYEISDKTAIDFIDGHSSILHLDTYKASELELLSFQINPHRLASHLQPIRENLEVIDFQKVHDLKLGSIGGKKIIVFDTTTYHLEFKKRVKTDFILIHNEAVKSLQWLKQIFDFDQIIFSNKNSYYYTRRMRQQATDLDLNIHIMKEDGAYRYAFEKDIKKERTPLSALFTTNPD